MITGPQGAVQSLQVLVEDFSERGILPRVPGFFHCGRTDPDFDAFFYQHPWRFYLLQLLSLQTVPIHLAESLSSCLS